MENGEDCCLERMDMRITKISDDINRITADNGGIFTGPGTNTYMVGKKEISVIDPGPDSVSYTHLTLPTNREV